MRVLTDSRLLACFDLFPNIDRIPNVQAPVFIIHGEARRGTGTGGAPPTRGACTASHTRTLAAAAAGQDDEEVPFEHGKRLYEACPEDLRFDPWWVSGASHNDVVEAHPDEYFRKLRRFLHTLQT